MTEPLSRRQALKQLAVFTGSIGALASSRQAVAASLPHLPLTETDAVLLGYTNEAATVNHVKFPTYFPGETCETCKHLLGSLGPAWRPCNIFPGYTVNVAGWCNHWSMKT